MREFVELAFEHVGRTIEWRGNGVDEKGHDAKTGDVLVAIDPRFFRPTEVDLLLGDPSKAKAILGWVAKINFKELVTEMVDSDLRLVKSETARADRGG